MPSKRYKKLPDNTSELKADLIEKLLPPSYAVGLPIPYEPGGSFSVELSVSPVINEVID